MSDDSHFSNYPNTKKKKSKRNKDAKKYEKTCAVYGIFDCTCCKKGNENRLQDSVTEEASLPSTSKEANIDILKNNTINNDLKNDTNAVPVPGTSNIETQLPETKYQQEEIESSIGEDTLDINIELVLDSSETLSGSCDTLETNESTSLTTKQNTVSDNIMEYINRVYEESGHTNMNPRYQNLYNNSSDMLDNEMQSNPMDDSEQTSGIEITLTIESPPTVTIEPQPTTETETVANVSIKSEVLPVTEEEEEIDVVNLPTEDVNTLNQNNSTLIQENNQDEIKTECNSDDENIIIDILNCDDTDHRENLVNNLENNTINMESTSNDNEDEIIDVENIVEQTPLLTGEVSSILQRARRHHLLKRKFKARYRLSLRKRPRLTQSVMTIDLINTTTDDSIIEITDSPVAPKKITEVINLDDDEDNNEVAQKSPTSPGHRIGLGNCPVCLENLSKKEIMSTICGHVFCTRCIKNVIKTTKKCPNCRKHLTLKSIHPLFI